MGTRLAVCYALPFLLLKVTLSTIWLETNTARQTDMQLSSISMISMIDTVKLYHSITCAAWKAVSWVGGVVTRLTLPGGGCGDKANFAGWEVW